MATFLTTNKILGAIEDIIQKATNEITFISPFLKIDDQIFERMMEANRKGIKINIVYGKDDLNNKELARLDKLTHYILYYYENLHAKCFFNEQQLIVGSMNLYKESQNNREMGILVDIYDTQGLKIYNDAKTEAESIITAAKLHTKKIPKEIIANSHILQVAPTINVYEGGYCIRCRNKISLSRKKPLCLDCYPNWVRFKNKDYEEKYCHQCGKEFASSVGNPYCPQCK